MPAVPEPQDGIPIWIDLGTPDVEATVAFYGGLFGWSYTSFGEALGDYGQFVKDGQPVAGVGPLMSPDQPATWGTYLKTSDLAATVAAATVNGATVAFGPDEVPGQGRFATVIDPAGAAIGFWQPEGHAGFGLYREHGAPAWHELHTRDYDGAVAFYSKAAGWGDDVYLMSDTADFRFATFPHEDSRIGIFDATRHLPDGVPPSWVVYLGTDDPDATAERAGTLGGTVVEPPVDTQYGRVATIADPHGTRFRLLSV